MFIGHYAVGLASKKWAPKASLGTLVAAAIWLDLAWPLFLLLDMEHFRIVQGITKMVPFDFYDYPLSHSLFMTLGWSGLLALVYLYVTKDNRGAWIVGALVASHWFLDLIVHRPDLPIWPVDVAGMPTVRVGLGLWNIPALEVLLECALFAAGIFLYLRSTKALDQTGSMAFWGFAAVLVVFYGANFFITPPNNPNLVSMMGFSQILFLAWAYWIDDHRKNIQAK